MEKEPEKRDLQAEYGQELIKEFNSLRERQIYIASEIVRVFNIPVERREKNDNL